MLDKTQIFSNGRSYARMRADRRKARELGLPYEVFYRKKYRERWSLERIEKFAETLNKGKSKPE